MPSFLTDRMQDGKTRLHKRNKYMYIYKLY